METAIRQKVLQDLERLPEDRVREVLDFVAFLLQRTEHSETSTPFGLRDPEHDPLLALIGSIDVAPFVQRIDDELYGR